MKVVIIDDELDAIYTLELIIHQFIPELQIVGKFSNPEKAIQEISTLKPDIVFLDINMPQMTGFELLQNIENINFHIVFTTAYNEYAIKAYKYNAFDYLLKPIDIDELKITVKRIKSKQKLKKIDISDLSQILERINKQKDDKICISTSEGLYFLKPSEIIYLIASGPYTKIIKKDGDILFVSKSLKELEDVFIDNFYRVHNSYTINLQFVKLLNKKKDWNLVMENGDLIPIARRKRNEIVDIISEMTGNII